MARLYRDRGDLPACAIATTDSPGLTAGHGPTIMEKLGSRGTRVNIDLFRQDGYDRIRPQGGGRFGAHQSLRGKYRRNSGEGDGGDGQIYERRSREIGRASCRERK